MMEESTDYRIGIDLGTTNSIVAYIDNHGSQNQESSAIQVFQVPQLMADGEVRALILFRSQPGSEWVREVLESERARE